MSQKVYGRITNFRTGPKSQNPKECLIQFTGISTSSLAGKLVGQKVTWKNETCSKIGKIASAHGRNGMVIVKFKHGVPGQAIGSVVELMN